MGESGARYTLSVVAIVVGLILVAFSFAFDPVGSLPPPSGGEDDKLEIFSIGLLLFIGGAMAPLARKFKDWNLRNTQSGAGSLQRRPLSGGGIAVMLVVIIGFIVVVIMAGTASTAEEAGIARISKAILLLFLLVLGLFGGLRNREEVGQEKEDAGQERWSWIHRWNDEKSENTPMSGDSPEVGGNFCENCGNALSPDTNYCSKCGTRRA
jgi:hypothetical protein